MLSRCTSAMDFLFHRRLTGFNCLFFCVDPTVVMDCDVKQLIKLKWPNIIIHNLLFSLLMCTISVVRGTQSIGSVPCLALAFFLSDSDSHRSLSNTQTDE